MSEKTDAETTVETDAVPIGFILTPVKSKPVRRYRKGSKYDPLLDAYLKGKRELVEVTIEGKKPNYIRTQLDKRIKAVPRFKVLKVSVTNDKCFLEVEKPKKNRSDPIFRSDYYRTAFIFSTIECSGAAPS